MTSQASTPERVSHVIRRLSMGTHPDLVADLPDADAAVDRALDLRAAGEPVLEMPAPGDDEAGRKVTDIVGPIAWWFGRMTSPERLVEERLVWFWHDHFATSLAKVPFPYLLWQQHRTVREHATGNFGELLKAVSRDPAMLLYLDGIQNGVLDRNENFGRECLELFTMGRDAGYTQDDVVAASRAFTGWVVQVPGRVATGVGQPWQATFIPRRHDTGAKTLLGTTANLDMDAALDVMLEHPATAAFVATKLYRELVGLQPDRATVTRLAKSFRRDYEIMPLVEAVARDDAFTSDAAVRARYRSPVEKVVAAMQAGGLTTLQLGGRRIQDFGLVTALRTMSHLPFLPPNVGGFPKGERLVGPGNLVHSFDLLQALPTVPKVPSSVDALFARFGVFDVSENTRAVVQRERDPGTRFALAFTSPEVTLT